MRRTCSAVGCRVSFWGVPWWGALLCVVAAGGCGDAGPPEDGQDVVASVDDAAPDVATVADALDSNSSLLDAASIDVPVAADAAVDSGSNVAHECNVDADCANLPTNLCLGPLYCDQIASPRRCRHNPASATKCDSSQDSACSVTECDPADGKCKTIAAPKGTPCVDDDPCSVDSACDSGTCKPGAASWCDCGKKGDCAAFEDGNPCTGTLYCDLEHFPFKCKVAPATVVQCDPSKSTQCALSACDKDSGKCALLPVKDGTPCDDGNKVTIGDACKAGKCGAGLIPACTSDEDCAAQDDGDLCNGTLLCDKGTGHCVLNKLTVITCSTVDDTECTVNTCDPKSGACNLAAKPNGAGCDDGDACTGGDVCVAGKCKAGQTYTCPCKSDADCVSKDDGDLCNGTYFCSSATKACVFNPATTVLCPSVGDSECAKNACTPVSGKCAMEAAGLTKLVCDLPAGQGKAPGCRRVVATGLPAAVTVACEDGNPCTKADVCDGLQCKGGIKVCECQSDLDCLAQDDGDLCNGVPFCDIGHKDATGALLPICKPNPGSKVFCSPAGDSECLKNRCDPKTGKCSLKPEDPGSACDDGEPCTVAEACVGSACTDGKPNPCSDGDGCTQDLCKAGVGCQHPAACDDGNPCTIDACAGGKCTFSATLAEGKGCDADGDGCTANDACKSGLCTKGEAVQCIVPLLPCQVAACSSTSATSFQCVAKAAVDGASCSDGDGCTVGDACAGGKCLAGSNDKLFVAEVPGLATGTVVEAVAAHGDGWLVAGRVDSSWTVARIAADRSVVWRRQAPVVGKVPAGLAAVVQTWEANKGEAVVAGTAVDAGAVKVRVIGWSADASKAAWTTWYAGKPQAELVGGLAEPAGGHVLLGSDGVGSNRGAFLAYVSTGGAQKWRNEPSALVPSVLSRRAGGYAVLGRRLVQGAWKPACVTVDSAGKHVSANVIPELLSIAAAAGQGDGVLIAGTRKVAGGTVGYVGGLNSECALDFSRNVDVPGLQPAAATNIGGDVAIVAGADISGGLLLPRANGLGAQSRAVVWQRSQPAQLGARWIAATRLADGTALLLGSDGQPGKSALIARISPWGHDSCANAGQCSGQAAKHCDDANPCTDDVCEKGVGGKGQPVAACVHLANKAWCDDGDACALEDRCNAGKCVGSKPRSCDDGNDCTDDSCNPKFGCAHKVFSGVPCPDKDPCTANEQCIKGTCTSAPKLCDDGDSCTKDSCAAGKGCVAIPDIAKCDDNNICTQDVCSPKTGCKSTPLHGAACEDGDACTTTDRCDQTVCKAGGGRWWQWKGRVAVVHHKANDSTLPPSRQLAAVTPDGQVTVAKRTMGATVLARWSATGQLQWTIRDYWPELSNGPSGQVRPQFVAVAPMPDSSVIALGYGRKSGTSNSQAHATFSRHDKAGKAVWRRVFAPYSYEVDEANAGWIDPAGGGVVGALRVRMTNDGARRLHIWSVSDSGTVRFSRVHADSAAVTMGRLVGAPDGGAAWTVTRGGSWWLQRVNAVGELLWSRSYPVSVSEFARRPGGYALASTVAKSSGGHVLWLGATDNDGNLLWSSGVANAPGFSPDGVAAMPDGGFVLSRPVHVSGTKEYNCELLRVSPQLDVTWSRGYNPTPLLSYAKSWMEDRCAQLIPLPGGGLQVAGSTMPNSGLFHLWLMRLDDWGHLSCGETGKCRDKATKGCDDGLLCSTDRCDPSKGCVHVDNTVRCDDGNACTGLGKCKEGSCEPGSARLFDATYGDVEQQRPVALAPDPSGGWLAIEGRQNDKPYPNALQEVLIRRWDAHGTQRSTLTVDKPLLPGNKLPALTQVHGVVRLHDGALLATGTAAASSHPGLALPHAVTWRVSVDGRVAAAHLLANSVGTFAYNSHLGAQDGLGRVMTFTSSSSSPYRTEAVAVSTTGKPLAGPVQLIAAGSNAVLQAAAGLAEGGFVLAGHTAAPAYKLRLQRIAVALDGKPEKTAVLRDLGASQVDGADPAKATFDARELLPLGDGGVLLVGQTTGIGAGLTDAWLVRLDEKLVPVWQTTVGSEDDEQVRGGTWAWRSGASLATGRIKRAAGPDELLVWGERTAAEGGSSQAFLWRLDREGRRLWARAFGGANADRLLDVALLPNGELGLLGATSSKGAGGDDTWLLRTDPWGAPSCTLSGKCLALEGSACDDGSPCTADRCDGATGCANPPTPGACREQPGCPRRWQTTDGKVQDWVQPRTEQFATVTAKAGADESMSAAAWLGESMLYGGSAGGVATVASRSVSGTLQWRWGAPFKGHISGLLGGERRAIAVGHTTDSRLGASGEDGVLASIADNGVARWVRTVGGDGADRLRGVTARAGTVWSVGSTKTDTAGDWDGWLVRANETTGAILGHKPIGGAKADHLHGIAWSGSTLITVGHSRSASKGGDFDAWIVRLSPTGEVTLQKHLTTPKDDFLYGVAGVDNGWRAVGSTANSGGGNGLLLRIDAIFQVAKTTYGHPQLPDALYSVTAHGNGTIAIAGSRNSDGAKLDGYLAVLDASTLAIKRQHIYSSPAAEQLNAVASTPDGALVIAGHRDNGSAGLDAWELRGTPWGDTDCQKAGKCAFSGPSGCDDGLLCTIDACDPTKGCTHTGDPATCAPVLNALAKPATSCRALQQAIGSAKSGRYNVLGNYANAKVMPVWCDMITDGGGWTLVAAIRADAPATFSLLDFNNFPVQPDALSTQGIGDVHVTSSVGKSLITTIGKSRGFFEYLVDTGAGLFRFRYKAQTSNTTLSNLYKPTEAAKDIVAAHYAPHQHAPVKLPNWVAVAPKPRSSPLCKSAGDCLSSPANIAGRFQQVHRRDGSPGAGFDGARMHPVRIYVR